MAAILPALSQSGGLQRDSRLTHGAFRQATPGPVVPWARPGRGRCRTRRAALCYAGDDNAPEPKLAGPLDSLEAAVPRDQRPHRELKQLKDDPMFKMATLGLGPYLRRLGFVWVGFFLLVGSPIAHQTFDFQRQPLEFVLSGALGAGLVTALAVLRVYLGWSYVGERLLSATLAYEETGWYDGQTFVKPPEVLARDRLLGAYEVRPTLRRLKGTLLGTGAGLALCGAALVGLIAAGADADGVYGRGAGRPVPRQRTPEGLVFSADVRSLADLAGDDDAAQAEAAALQGSPPGGCLYEAPFTHLCRGGPEAQDPPD